MKQYVELVNHVLENGVLKKNRTGIDTISVFGYQMRFDLSKGFPLLTTKKLHWKSIAHELLWFISGSTDVKYLKDNGITIWNEWTKDDGTIGPGYGYQWRHWNEDRFSIGDDEKNDLFDNPSRVDQLSNVVERIKTHPDCRRLIVSAWNASDLPQMALAPCHCLFQFNITNGRLNCQLYQRSADVGLGVPYNIASYSLLTMMVAQECSLEPGEFIWTGGDTHIYVNHINAVKEQISRELKQIPKVSIDSGISLFDIEFKDIKLEDYNPHPSIKMEVAV